MGFVDSLNTFLEVFDNYSKNYFPDKIKVSASYSPLITDYYKKLSSFSGGGKRIRSYLVYLGYQVGDKSDMKKILPISLAFEMSHNFLLIHDDIMDNSDLRRGKPTIHKTYEKKHGKHFGISTAILLGDIALLEVFKIVNDSKFSDTLKADCMAEFADILLETGYGQGLDLEFGFTNPTVGEIMQVAQLKAARYSIIGPLVIGAKLSEAQDSQITALTSFGSTAGIAFQIQDDILGVFGDEETIGKSVVSDMREGKGTLLIYKTRELANKRDKKIINDIWGNIDADIDDLEQIRKIIKSSGALEWCQEENKRLVAKSKSEVEKITRDSKLQTIFAEIADFVISREK